MSTEVAAQARPADLAANAAAEARTFKIIDVAGVTIPELIRAVIDGDATVVKWPAGDEGGETAVLERLAQATTTAELFGDQEATGWAELLDVPVEVHGYRLLPSTMENSIMFAVVDVYRLDEGERTVVTTSARGVLVQLLQGVLVGAIPGVFKLTEVGKETKGRSRAQRLIRMGDLTQPPADDPF